MSRIQDFVFLAIVILASLVIVTVGDALLEPLFTHLTGAPVSSAQESNMDAMRAAVVKWVPLIANIGAIVIVAWREFRRQRVTSVRRGVGP